MTRIFPSDHESVRQYLRDFRVAENGQRWIARLRGEGKFRSTVFPELREKSPQVLVELIPVASWRRPSFAIRWLTALRLPYLTISLFPLLLVLSARLGEGGRLSPAHTILLLTSVSLIHLACNLWSDFEDHIRGVDLPGQSGGSGVIQNLWIPAIHLRNAVSVYETHWICWERDKELA